MSRSPSRRAIDQMCADGDWHARGPLLTAAIAAVPPGQAIRTAQATRAQRRKGATALEYRQSDAQTVGARAIGREAVNSAMRSPEYELTVIDGVRCIRLRSGDTILGHVEPSYGGTSRTGRNGWIGIVAGGFLRGAHKTSRQDAAVDLAGSWIRYMTTPSRF